MATLKTSLEANYDNIHVYNIFSLSHEYQFVLFLDFWPLFYIFKGQKGIFTCVCFIFLYFVFPKDLESQEVPGRSLEF